MKRRFRVIIDGEVYEVEAEVDENGDFLSLLRELLGSGVKPSIGGSLASYKTATIKSEGIITAPIAGRVMEVRVRPGELVNEDTVVAVLEAMKTQVEIKAGRRGKVSEVMVKEGDNVRQGQGLVRLD